MLYYTALFYAVHLDYTPLYYTTLRWGALALPSMQGGSCTAPYCILFLQYYIVLYHLTKQTYTIFCFSLALYYKPLRVDWPWRHRDKSFLQQLYRTECTNQEKADWWSLISSAQTFCQARHKAVRREGRVYNLQGVWLILRKLARALASRLNRGGELLRYTALYLLLYYGMEQSTGALTFGPSLYCTLLLFLTNKALLRYSFSILQCYNKKEVTCGPAREAQRQVVPPPTLSNIAGKPRKGRLMKSDI